MKSQGLSLNVIVLAALALFILVVLILIFSGKIGVVSDFYSDCSELDGELMSYSEDCPDGKPISAPIGKEDDKKCCVEKLV